jgi:hypothetical protein
MVISPLIDHLSMERLFLSKGNPTWIVVAERCESLRPIAEHIERDQEPTLRQLLRYNPQLQRFVDDHDRLLQRVEVEARGILPRLLTLPAFLTLLDRIEGEYPDWRGAYSREQGPQLLAEMIINWSDDENPPINYTNAKAWRAHRAEGLRLRENPQVSPAFAELKSAVVALYASTTELENALSALRDQLADEFGLPAAAPHIPSMFGDGL